VKAITAMFITNQIIDVLRIMLGVMMVTMFLSMWINNTATCGMMVPIADAMLEELSNHSYTQGCPDCLTPGGLTLKISKIGGGLNFTLVPPLRFFPEEIFQGATPPTPLWASLVILYIHFCRQV
jgi:hypothetical protein